MIAALIVLPLMSAMAAVWIRPDRPRRALLVATAVVHAVLTAGCWLAPPEISPEAWLGLDAAGRLFLGIASLLFLAVSGYAVHCLGREASDRPAEGGTGSGVEAVFTACLLVFLFTMTLAAASRHLGVLWVAVEGTTLATAPLIYYHRQPRSLEATWKYLLVCSVGIALALLGTFLLVIASAGADGTGGSLLISELMARGGAWRVPWLKAAWVFLLVGYGTKMGLVPMHTWLPDAHSEAPSPVSALLSGALLNCAFLGILRAHALCVGAGLGEYSGGLLAGFGLVSMAVAAAFLVHQTDYKRMLAYSSVEHMGLLALGTGLGGAALIGALLHAVNHSMGKAALFMVAGNLLWVYRTKNSQRVQGALRTLPVSGVLWLAGLLALTGSPPFGSFASEFILLKEAFGRGPGGAAMGGAALLALTIAFIGMSRTMLRMALGRSAEGEAERREPAASYGPALVLMAGTLVLGLWIPRGLMAVLEEASRQLGGGVP